MEDASARSPVITNGKIWMTTAEEIFPSDEERLRILEKRGVPAKQRDGKIYFSSHQGLITVIEPGQEFRVIAGNHLDDTIMASPLAFDGTLLVRTGKAIYRFGK